MKAADGAETAYSLIVMATRLWTHLGKQRLNRGCYYKATSANRTAL